MPTLAATGDQVVRFEEIMRGEAKVQGSRSQVLCHVPRRDDSAGQSTQLIAEATKVTSCVEREDQGETGVIGI